MKAAARKKITQIVCSEFQDFVELGRLLYMTPVEHVLRGIYLEDSSNSNACYIWVFVQPLYVPSSTVNFNFGKRLGGGSKAWGVADAMQALVGVLSDEGVPFIRHLSCPEAVANWGFLDTLADPYAMEAKAYSLLASGRIAEGVHALRVLSVSLSRVTPSVPWVLEMKDRAELLAKITETEVVKVRGLLSRWEAETVAQLRLPASLALSSFGSYG